MEVILRMTGLQHAQLREQLYPGDGNEAVAIVLCGRHQGKRRHILTVREIIPVAPKSYHLRSPSQASWSTAGLPAILQKAARKGMAILKIHSHPNGFEQFSPTDDRADRELFASFFGWMENDLPHASAVMLPDGRIFGRNVEADLTFAPLAAVAVAGDDLQFWFANEQPSLFLPEYARRQAQAFGRGTVALLRRLSVAVVGCSGTGSPVIEQLARLGIGKLVLIDPDRVEEKNLNRILNTTMSDAKRSRSKVQVLARAIEQMGFGTEVIALETDLQNPQAIQAVAEADIVFGCMDSIDGRHLLIRLAVFYNLPYFDVGVKLVADGNGGVEQICGTIHYLQPDRSSLLSRGVYTQEQLLAAALKKANPDVYAERLREKYIVGVQEERPAVISVNMLFAAFAVNEFLARLHRYRDDSNEWFAVARYSLTQGQFYQEPESDQCPVLSRHVGRGDTAPLLDLPELSGEAPRQREAA